MLGTFTISPCCGIVACLRRSLQRRWSEPKASHVPESISWESNRRSTAPGDISVGMKEDRNGQRDQSVLQQMVRFEIICPSNVMAGVIPAAGTLPSVLQDVGVSPHRRSRRQLQNGCPARGTVRCYVGPLASGATASTLVQRRATAEKRRSTGRTRQHAVRRHCMTPRRPGPLPWLRRRLR